MSREIPSMNDVSEDDNEEDVETMTASEALQKLEEAWLNEKFAPDLLEGKMDLVECMLEQIHAMEDNLSLAQKGDLKISLHRMEIDRIRYIISSYLRLRLSKIEKFTIYILEQESRKKDDEKSFISEAEEQFARKYLESVKSHFSVLALKHMPPNMQSSEKEFAGVKPNLDSCIFLRVNKSTKNVLIEEETVDTGEEIVDLEQGDQHILRYKPIASLVTSGAVTLI